MAKYILASDFYAHGVGHFKKSSGPFDWREIPDHVKVPSTAKRLDNAPEKPIAAAATIPVIAGQKPQTVEEILQQRMAPPVQDHRDVRIKEMQEEMQRLRDELNTARQPATVPAPEPEKQPEPQTQKPDDGAGEQGAAGSGDANADPAALLASRDTKGRASGGKASK